MQFGWSNTQEIALRTSPQEALSDLRQALFQIGQVGTVDESKFILEGTTRYGAQKVRLKIVVEADGDGSILVVTGTSDDIWAYGAKQGIKQLLDALEGIHGPAATPHQISRARSDRAPSLEDRMSWGQKISLPALLLVVSLGSLIMSQFGGPILSPPMLGFYALASLTGAVTSFFWVPARYFLIAIPSGLMAALSGVALCLGALHDATTVYRIVLFFLAVIGLIPGVLLFLGLRLLQDFVLPPRRSASSSASENRFES